jgi:hypothetical protein
MAAKADVVLGAFLDLTCVANVDLQSYVNVETLSDAAAYQVLDVVAVEVFWSGGVCAPTNNVSTRIQLVDGSTALQSFTDSKLKYECARNLGAGSFLQFREQVTAPVMVAGAELAVVYDVTSVAAGKLYGYVKVYGNYRKLSEVEYLRLTC